MTTRSAWLASLLIVGAFYFWIIGIGAVPDRFAWNSGLDQYYGLPSPAIAKGSWDINGYYDLLGRAFVQGHLYLPVKPPPELLALSDPQDNTKNGPYKLLDVVLYKQRYYLYHGPTPAILLFFPWRLITQHDLPENFAAFLLATFGYIFLSLLFLNALAFASIRVPAALLMLCLLALGIGQLVPFVLHRAKVYEIAILCGYCCVSAGFYFLLRALMSGKRFWSVLSGLSFGLAIGSRPHLGLAAVAGFVILAIASRRELVAFLVPVIACGLAIAAYNYARFADPLEFGLRYQLADTGYQHIHLSLVNETPGLYYLLLCPPHWVPEFPFVRLAWRLPFESNPLPPRYFLEPTDSIFAICPIALLALALPLCRKRLGGRRELFVFLASMLAFAGACVLFIAATGLSSERFEVDFLPFVLLVACVVAFDLCTRTWLTVAVAAPLLYSIGANVAIALQGPYDQFVQASPSTYVKLAKWFSPFEAYRLIENPELRLQASFNFPQPCIPGVRPLISTGEFGSRYLLSEACYPDGRLELWSETSVAYNERKVVPVAYSAGFNLVGLKFTPSDRIMTIDWNGRTVLRQPLRFLVTSRSQIHFGSDPTWSNPSQFPGKIAVYQVELSASK